VVAFIIEKIYDLFEATADNEGNLKDVNITIEYN